MSSLSTRSVLNKWDEFFSFSLIKNTHQAFANARKYLFITQSERERDYNNKFVYLMWTHSAEPMRGLLIRNNDNSHRFLLIMPWFVRSFFPFCRWTCSSNEKHVLHRIEHEPDTKAFGWMGERNTLRMKKKNYWKNSISLTNPKMERTSR